MTQPTDDEILSSLVPNWPSEPTRIELAQYLADTIPHGVLGDTGQRLAHYREIVEALNLDVILVKEGEIPPLYSISGWFRDQRGIHEDRTT